MPPVPAQIPQPTLTASLPNTPPPGRTVNITLGAINVTSSGDGKVLAEELRTVTVEAVLEALERAAKEEGACSTSSIV